MIGGDLRIEAGAAVVTDGDAPGSPLTVVVGGATVVEGRMPPRVTFALAPGARVGGSVESPVLLQTELTRGVAAGVELGASAATEWLPLPVATGDAIDVELEDVRGAIRAELQVAPPDVLRPDRPQLGADRFIVPLRLPLQQPLSVPRGAWFRVLFEADVAGGDVPSVGGIAVHGK